MKVRHFEIEVTVDEIESSALLARLLTAAMGLGTLGDEDPEEIFGTKNEGATRDSVKGEDLPGVPEEGQRTVQAQLANNPAAAHFRRFLAETSAWPNVVVHGIKPKGTQSGAPIDFTRYLRIRRHGSRFGGFVYTYPIDGHVNFRLAFETDEELHSIAPDAWRSTKGHHQYRTSIRILDEETLRQALELAGIAYKRTEQISPEDVDEEL